MTFETEYQLQEFREVEKDYFDENGEYYSGLMGSNPKWMAEQMLKLINQMEAEIKMLKSKTN